jgi:formiminoglutamate deiminase
VVITGKFYPAPGQSPFVTLTPRGGAAPRAEFPGAWSGDDVHVITVEASTAPRRWHAELAWLARTAPDCGATGGATGGVAKDVLIEARGARFTAVAPGTPAERLPPGTARLRGLTLPGLANAHSHAFHRALRGAPAVTGRPPGDDTFWTWRDRMYAIAERLDPGTYFTLARAVYAEMALAGVTCVGEFHYLHHGPGGKRYSDRNEPGRLLIAAAAAAGLRITLLDACYLAGGFLPGGEPLPLAGAQLRFGDGSAAAWAERVCEFGCDSIGMVAPHARLGAAIHSVRAVGPDQMPEVMAWSHAHAAPVHAHLSEQTVENAECRAAFGATPAELLYETGVLGPRSTMVHATHLTDRDVALLGGSLTAVCVCPLTEADLADGVGPAPALAAAGSPLALGSDGHSAIDLIEEARWLELSQRLISRWRGHFTPTDLAVAATVGGHACLGWPDAGEIMPGAYADLVTLSLDSPRLAGAAVGDPLAALFAAGTAADVLHVVAGGVDVVSDGHHLLVDDVPGELAAAIRAVLG